MDGRRRGLVSSVCKRMYKPEGLLNLRNIVTLTRLDGRRATTRRFLWRAMIYCVRSAE